MVTRREQKKAKEGNNISIHFFFFLISHGLETLPIKLFKYFPLFYIKYKHCMVIHSKFSIMAKFDSNQLVTKNRLLPSVLAASNI